MKLFRSESKKYKKYTTTSSLDIVIERLISKFYSIQQTPKQYNCNKKQVSKLVISLIKDIPIPRINMISSLSEKECIVIDNEYMLTSLFFFVNGVFPKSKATRKESYDFKEIYSLTKEYEVSLKNKVKLEIKKELKDKYGLIFTNFSYNGVRLSYKDFPIENQKEIRSKAIEFNIISLSFQKKSIKNKEIELQNLIESLTE
ncbi:MAG: hypothetical protein ACRC6E_13340 [Fusobacteriaceae bacterium]